MGEESCKINNKMIIDYYYDSDGNCKIYKNGKLIKDNTRYGTEIKADRIELLGSKKD